MCLSFIVRLMFIFVQKVLLDILTANMPHLDVLEIHLVVRFEAQRQAQTLDTFSNAHTQVSDVVSAYTCPYTDTDSSPARLVYKPMQPRVVITNIIGASKMYRRYLDWQELAYRYSLDHSNSSERYTFVTTY